jgi:hypothetical protein
VLQIQELLMTRIRAGMPRHTAALHRDKTLPPHWRCHEFRTQTQIATYVFWHRIS